MYFLNVGKNVKNGILNIFAPQKEENALVGMIGEGRKVYLIMDPETDEEQLEAMRKLVNLINLWWKRLTIHIIRIGASTVCIHVFTTFTAFTISAAFTAYSFVY